MSTRVGSLNVEVSGDGPVVFCWPSLYCDARALDPLVDTVESALRRCQRRGLLLAARWAMFERENMVPLLPEVTVPTVFFAGADDALLTVEEARQQTAALPRCRFVVVERSSHQSALEAPSQVLPVVHEALAEWAHA